MRSIGQILKETQTIAIVGLSANPGRASNEVARYLLPHYKLVGVNPNYDEVLGIKCYPDLESLPGPVDLVDVFQRSERVMPFVQPAINIGCRCFWMQIGIQNAAARDILEAAGTDVVENKCTKVEHRFL